MKKLNRNLLIIGSVILLLFSTCQDFLDIAPPGSLAPENMASESGSNALLVGAYNRLLNLNRTSAGYASDDIGNGGSSTSFGTFDGTGSIAGSWTGIYDAVQRANDVLRMLKKTVDANAISAANALQIESEARFLRAVFHMEAALWWRNVPYLDETNTFSDGTYFVSNTEPIWPKIEADFQFAKENLTETKSEVGRANKWAAEAFLAKAYMFQLKFAEAKVLLEDLIANGQTSNGLKYGLNEKYWDNFNTTGKHGPESVFTVQNCVWVGGNLGNPSYYLQGTYYGPAANCCGWAMPSEDLADAFQTDPETGLPLLFEAYKQTPVKRDYGVLSATPWTPHEGTLDSRIDWNMGRRGIPYLDWGVHPGRNWHRWPTVTCYSFIKNTASQAGGTGEREITGDGPQTSNAYNMIRFADVLLWAAECEVEIGSLAQAETYVNQVRARASNPAGFVHKYLDDSNPLGGFSDIPAANYKVGLYSGQFAANGKPYAREAVRFERRLELACEYHRWFDLQRYDAQEPGTMGNTLNTYLEGRLHIPGAVIKYPTNWQFRIGINEVGMIPQTEIDLMESMAGFPVLIQNPGYESN